MKSPKFLFVPVAIAAWAIFLADAACFRPPKQPQDGTAVIRSEWSRRVDAGPMKAIFNDLSTHRLVIDKGQVSLLVQRGTPEEAESYYKKVNDELEVSGDILQSRLDDLLDYCGYRELDAAAIEVADSVNLMRDAGIQSTIFFAPKIVDVSGQTNPLEYGWRKLIRLKSQASSRAASHNISSLWLLFNFFSREPAFPGGRAGQIQAILESSRDGGNAFPVYFFVYENNASDYRLKLFLNASFDGATQEPDEKYYVPNACAQCHGDSSSGMSKAKINYLDTDHWFDRARDDFQAVLPESVLPNGGHPGSRRFDRAFEVYRQLNAEITSQNRSVDPNGFQVRAVENWVRLHRTNSDPIPPLERGIPGKFIWAASEQIDAELLPLLNRYCFRCHSSFEYHVFDKAAVKSGAGWLAFLVQIGGMPLDRKLDEGTKARLVYLLESLSKQ